MVVKYAATGNGGTISNNVRLGVCLLTVFAGLLLFYLRKRLRILYGLLEFGVATALAWDAAGGALAQANLSAAGEGSFRSLSLHSKLGQHGAGGKRAGCIS